AHLIRHSYPVSEVVAGSGSAPGCAASSSMTGDRHEAFGCDCPGRRPRGAGGAGDPGDGIALRSMPLPVVRGPARAMLSAPDSAPDLLPDGRRGDARGMLSAGVPHGHEGV